MSIKKWLLFTLVVFVGTFVSASSYSFAAVVKQDPIFVTIAPQFFIIKSLIGEEHPVQVLLREGQSPHHFEVSPKTAVALSSSLAYFTIGLPLEKNVFGKSSKEIPYFKMDRGIKKIKNKEHAHHHDEGDHQGHHEAEDPHIWSSFENLILITDNSAQDLIQLFPAEEKKITANKIKLIAEIKEAKELATKKLSACQSKLFFTTHASLAYLTKELGLTEKALQEEGKSFSPSKLKQFFDEIKKHQAKVFLYRKGLDDVTKEKIATEIKMVFYPFNPIEENVVDNLSRFVQLFSENCH